MTNDELNKKIHEASAQEIIKGARHYAEYMAESGEDPKFTTNPQEFISGQIYMNYQEKVRTPKKIDSVVHGVLRMQKEKREQEAKERGASKNEK